MLKFYRLEARRILAGQKKMSTTLVTARGAVVLSRETKGIDSQAACWKCLQGKAFGLQRFVEKLRTKVDNAGGIQSGLRNHPGEGAQMTNIEARFVGVELYFEDLERAKRFYAETLNLTIAEDEPGHHAKFDNEKGFICLEKKGVESYPSQDKAVLFFEVLDLEAAIAAIGKERLVHGEKAWAVLHDPEGHNVLLFERRN
jgi:predicted enzyme related to lactoylglutathione lyase